MIVEDLEMVIPTINSMINRIEKIKSKFKEGSSQLTLIKNRLNAFHISIALVSKALQKDVTTNNYTKEELEKALPPITSTISKCEKVKQKLKTGSPQLTLTVNMLKALSISSALIKEELNSK
jgi:hypothetical protein